MRTHLPYNIYRIAKSIKIISYVNIVVRPVVQVVEIIKISKLLFKYTIVANLHSLTKIVALAASDCTYERAKLTKTSFA